MFVGDAVQAGLGQSGDAGSQLLVMENVTQVEVDGDTIRLRSLLRRRRSGCRAASRASTSPKERLVLRETQRGDERTWPRKSSQTEAIVEKYGGDKSMLIQILLEIQRRNRWLSEDDLRTVSREPGCASDPGLPHRHLLQGLQPGAQGEALDVGVSRHRLPGAQRPPAARQGRGGVQDTAGPDVAPTCGSAWTR